MHHHLQEEHVKKSIVLALFIVTATFSFGFNEEHLNLVTFENLTDQTIEFIFLSPGDSEYWGPDILGSERVLGEDDALGFWILYPNECDNFDIMAVGEDGGTFEIFDYEICDGSTEIIEFVNKDLSDDPPEMYFVNVYIQNETIPVYYIFISPSDSEMWGVDYLDETTILDTDEYVNFLFPASASTTDYYLLGVDEDGDEYQFSFEIDEDSDESVYSIEIDDLVY